MLCGPGWERVCVQNVRRVAGSSLIAPFLSWHNRADVHSLAKCFSPTLQYEHVVTKHQGVQPSNFIIWTTTHQGVCRIIWRGFVITSNQAPSAAESVDLTYTDNVLHRVVKEDKIQRCGRCRVVLIEALFQRTDKSRAVGDFLVQPRLRFQAQPRKICKHDRRLPGKLFWSNGPREISARYFRQHSLEHCPVLRRYEAVVEDPQALVHPQPHKLGRVSALLGLQHAQSL